MRREAFLRAVLFCGCIFAARLATMPPKFGQAHAFTRARFRKPSDAASQRCSRYRGLQKTHLQEIAVVTGMNILRSINFLNKREYWIRKLRIGARSARPPAFEKRSTT